VQPQSTAIAEAESLAALSRPEREPPQPGDSPPSARSHDGDDERDKKDPVTARAAPEPAKGLLDRLAGSIGARAGAASVFGAPIERDGVTVIPIASSRFAFGGGGGPTPDGKGEGEGGGGAVASRPLGFIEIRDGRARFRQVRDPIALGTAVVAVAIAVAILARSAARLGGALRTGER
jgi:uncharacterized spore protein YtfJ